MVSLTSPKPSLMEAKGIAVRQPDVGDGTREGSHPYLGYRKRMGQRTGTELGGPGGTSRQHTVPLSSIVNVIHILQQLLLRPVILRPLPDRHGIVKMKADSLKLKELIGWGFNVQH
jgi:hypothetical protein